MALLSFVDRAPQAYRLKVGNAYLTFSTSTGTSPKLGPVLENPDLADLAAATALGKRDRGRRPPAFARAGLCASNPT